MAAFKPAYLIHGDDHGRIAERRARLRALAERESGASGAELFEGEAATPEGVGGALTAMTFAIGRRFVIVDGVERWRDRDVEAHVAPALAALAPETTVAFFAREEGRAKAPPQLHAAVKRAGGEVAAETALKPWELPKWTRAQAQRLGIELDAGAAQALIALVGDRQQRLLRELERLELELGPGAKLSADEVEERAASSAERRVWSLADALVARDAAAATRCYLGLRAQGERLPSLLYGMAQRVRQALELATRLEADEPAAQLKRSLRMPPRAAERLIADVQRTDSEHLRRALEALADLELDSRGGAQVRGGRAARGALDEDTAALRAIAAIAA